MATVRPTPSRPTAVLAARIEDLLRASGTPERAANERRYLKSDLSFFGVTVPAMRRAVATALGEQAPLDRLGALGLARVLWAGPAVPLHERRMAAVEVLERHARLLEPGDLGLVEAFLREARTWALVDGLAVNVAGSVVAAAPQATAARLDAWSVDADFWVRRAALLALLRPLRGSATAWPRFAGYADAMVDDPEFFIRKAIGWVLRDTGKRRPAEVEAWLGARLDRVSGVTMREAVKYLPPERREALVAAWRRRR